MSYIPWAIIGIFVIVTIILSVELAKTSKKLRETNERCQNETTKLEDEHQDTKEAHDVQTDLLQQELDDCNNKLQNMLDDHKVELANAERRADTKPSRPLPPPPGANPPDVLKDSEKEMTEAEKKRRKRRLRTFFSRENFMKRSQWFAKSRPAQMGSRHNRLKYHRPGDFGLDMNSQKLNTWMKPPSVPNAWKEHEVKYATALSMKALGRV